MDKQKILQAIIELFATLPDQDEESPVEEAMEEGEAVAVEETKAP